MANARRWSSPFNLSDGVVFIVFSKDLEIEDRILSMQTDSTNSNVDNFKIV